VVICISIHVVLIVSVHSSLPRETFKGVDWTFYWDSRLGMVDTTHTYLSDTNQSLDYSKPFSRNFWLMDNGRRSITFLDYQLGSFVLEIST